MAFNAYSIRKWTIYKIVNPIEQVYIGKTCDFSRRLIQHKSIKTQTNKYLKRSIEQFGWQSHKAIILDEFESNDAEAQGREIFWIRSLMSNVNRWPNNRGLNQTDGGVSVRGYKQTIESIEKRRQKQIGKTISAEQRKKISQKLTGVKLSKHRAINIGKGHQKAMNIYDLNGNFIKECESSRHVYYFLYGRYGTSGHIAEVARGVRASYKGYIFKYKHNV